MNNREKRVRCPCRHEERAFPRASQGRLFPSERWTERFEEVFRPSRRNFALYTKIGWNSNSLASQITLTTWQFPIAANETDIKLKLSRRYPPILNDAQSPVDNRGFHVKQVLGSGSAPPHLLLLTDRGDVLQLSREGKCSRRGASQCIGGRYNLKKTASFDNSDALGATSKNRSHLVTEKALRPGATSWPVQTEGAFLPPRSWLLETVLWVLGRLEEEYTATSPSAVGLAS
jgi:hypothetical protein